jgi:hypothetical protein
MHSSQSQDDFLRRICDASSRNDATTIASLLGCRRITSPCLEEPLLCFSQQAEILLESVFAPHSDGTVDSRRVQPHRLPENTRPEHAARALLIAPTAYEIPWKAACEFVAHLHAQDSNHNKDSANRSSSMNRSFLRSSVADIQSFLQQAVASWWEEDRKQTAANRAPRSVRPTGSGEKLSPRNPRHWILRLVSVVMKPLHQSDETDELSGNNAATATRPQTLRDNGHWTVPLELISTTISLSRDLESSLLDSCLDLVFRQPIRPDRILPWVNLASELRLFLRDDDWRALQLALKKVLSADPCPVHQQDLPGLSEGILSLCSALISKRNFQQEDLMPWKELVLQLLLVASGDLATFSTVETILESNLGALPTTALQQWTLISTTPVVAKNEDMPTWVHANMLLLVLRAVRNSGSQLVSKLVARALGGRDGLDLPAECWNRLVLLTVGRIERPKRKGRRTKSSSLAVEDLQRLLDGVTYAGSGRFERTDGTEATLLSAAGTVVFQSLFLGRQQQQQRSAHMYVMERAQAWVHTATAILESSRQEFEDSREYVLVLAVLITIFCEVPMARSSLVRCMVQSFSIESNLAHDALVASLHCLVISVVLQTKEDGHLLNPNNSELDQVADVFSKQLPMTLFFDLARALSPLPSARRALLAAARKGLQTPFETDLWWTVGTSCRGAKENIERLKCGLFALCTLVSSSEWGGLEVEAWKILSDAVVESKPPLPTAARTWLFSHLKELARDRSLCVDAAEHVLRACLVRLLSFFGSDQSGRVRFAPEKLFVVWDDRSEQASSQSKQIEDFVGLFDLVLTLVHYVAYWSSGKVEQRAILSLWRGKLLSLIYSWRKTESVVELDEVHEFRRAPTPTKCDDVDLLCNVAVQCVFAILRYVLEQKFVLEGVALSSSQEMAAMLVSQESRSLGLVNVDLLPAWMHQPSHGGAFSSTPSAFNKSQSKPLRIALCDMVTEFMIGTRWLFAPDDSDICLRDDELKQLSLGVSAIVAAKRKLTGSLHRDQHAKVLVASGTETACRIFEVLCASSLRPIETAISEEGNLEEIDEMVAAILDLCEVMTRLSEADSFDGKHRFERHFVVLWELYSSLCEEVSVVRFISYLESQHASWSDESQESASLRSIRCAGDIDSAVRRIRSTVLGVVLSYFSALNRQSWHRSASNGAANSNQSHVSLLNFVGALSHDLLLGLAGASGGLTSDLFLLYTDCIDACAGALTNLVPDMSQNERRSVWSVCTKAATSLETILCRVALKGSALFRKAAMLTSYILPSVSRLAVRSFLLDTTEGGTSDTCTPSVFAAVSLKQCLGVMKPGGGANVSSALDCDMLGDHSGAESDGVEGLRNIPAVVVVSPGAVPRGTARDANGANRQAQTSIQLGSEKVWSWAFSSALLAFEQTCGESQQTIQHTLPMFRSHQGAKTYFARRKEEVENIFETVGLVFKDTSQEGSAQDKREKTVCDSFSDPLTVQLPTAVKLRLNALLDRMLSVLQRAIQLIVKYYRSHAGFESITNRLALVEALVCVSAWLQQRTTGVEFTTGARRWYAAEKRRAALPQTKRQSHIAEASVLRRLPNTMFRIEELEESLLKTYQLFVVSKQTARKKRQSEVLREYASFIAGSEDDDSLSTHGSKLKAEPFQAMLLGKLNFLEEQRSVLEKELQGSSSDELAGGLSRKRKSAQEVERLVQREGRRRVVRSRNQIVDKWLQMDQNIGQDEGFDDDAYADLEDFLADG